MKKPAKNPIDQGAPAAVIRDKFGGLVKFCDALTEARREIQCSDADVKPSTVHRWLAKGLIPSNWFDIVNRAAELRRVRIKPADYIDTRTADERAAAREAIAA